MAGLERFLGGERERGEDPPQTFFEAVITETATALSETIGAQELHGNEFFHPDCRWSPRLDTEGAVLLPEKGDRALVAIDDAGNEWIVEWWPYG